MNLPFHQKSSQGINKSSMIRRSSVKLRGLLPNHTLVLLTLVACSPPAGAATPSLLRGPYLQMGTPSNLVVQLRTDTSTVGRVRFGLQAADLAFAADEAAAGTNHSVLLGNLSPDTIYFDSVGLTNQTLAGGTNYFFRTAPPGGSHRPFRVWVLGDFGFTNQSAIPVRNGYYNFTTNHYTDLFFMLGDNAYHTGHDGV